MGYRPEIDGLRALAVLLVLAYHAQLGFPGGYVGVDVFFVISGYLITRLLMKELREGTFSYLGFWLRRFRRLVPAAALFSTFMAVSGYLLLLPDELESLGGALMAQPLLCANVYFSMVIEDGYFGTSPETQPMLHTWSLGLEEQFYLLYPLLLLFLWKAKPLRERLPACLGVLLVLSLVLTAVLSVGYPIFTFFNLPTRAWELLLGALLAFFPRIITLHTSLAEVLGWLGLGLILFSAVIFGDGRTLPGTAMLLPCLGAALFIFINEKPTSSGRFMSTKPVVWIGLISYSLYLWHWPIIAYADYFSLLTHLPAKLAFAALSFLPAYLSFRYIESPIRKKTFLPVTKDLLTLTVLYAALSLAVGGYFFFNKGLPQNWSKAALLFARTGQLPYEFALPRIDLTKELPPVVTVGSLDAQAPSFLVWGDSHAQSSLPLFEQLGQAYQQKGLALVLQNTPALASWPEGTKQEHQQWLNGALELVRTHDIKRVFLVSRWADHTSPNFGQDLKTTIEALQAEGCRVVFVTAVPEQRGAAPRQLALSTRYPILSTARVSEEEYRLQQQEVTKALTALSAVEDSAFEVVDIGPITLDWGLTIDDEPLYIDTHHLTEKGAILLRPVFEHIFRQEKQEDRNSQ